MRVLNDRRARQNVSDAEGIQRFRRYQIIEIGIPIIGPANEVTQILPAHSRKHSENFPFEQCGACNPSSGLIEIERRQQVRIARLKSGNEIEVS